MWHSEGYRGDLCSGAWGKLVCSFCNPSSLAHCRRLQEACQFHLRKVNSLAQRSDCIHPLRAYSLTPYLSQSEYFDMTISSRLGPCEMLRLEGSVTTTNRLSTSDAFRLQRIGRSEQMANGASLVRRLLSAGTRLTLDRPVASTCRHS